MLEAPTPLEPIQYPGIYNLLPIQRVNQSMSGVRVAPLTNNLHTLVQQHITLTLTLLMWWDLCILLYSIQAYQVTIFPLASAGSPIAARPGSGRK